MRILKLHTLNCSAETKITGAYPQIQVNFSKAEKLNDFDFRDLNGEHFPDKPLSFIPFELVRKAKKTNIFSCRDVSPSVGLFMDDNCRSVFENHLLNRSQFYDFFLENKLKMNFLHIIDDDTLIDYSNSIFVDYDAQETDIKLSSNIDFLSLNDEKGKYFIPKKIVLKKEVDAFRIPYETYIYISERLKSSIDESSLTGTHVKKCGNHIQWEYL